MLESVLDQSPAGVAGDMSHLLFKVLIAALAALAVHRGRWTISCSASASCSATACPSRRSRKSTARTKAIPPIKAKIRQIRQERATKRMMAAVPEATVVITNPTHFAVALKYEIGKMAAPICVAKGVDALALRIREVAEEHDVPIVENPPLARALHAAVEVDEADPAGALQGRGPGHRLCHAADRQDSRRQLASFDRNGLFAPKHSLTRIL